MLLSSLLYAGVRSVLVGFDGAGDLVQRGYATVADGARVGLKTVRRNEQACSRFPLWFTCYIYIAYRSLVLGDARPAEDVLAPSHT